MFSDIASCNDDEYSSCNTSLRSVPRDGSTPFFRTFLLGSFGFPSYGGCLLGGCVTRVVGSVELVLCATENLPVGQLGQGRFEEPVLLLLYFGCNAHDEHDRVSHIQVKQHGKQRSDALD